jgi:predicted O-methyltransferase YrrM
VIQELASFGATETPSRWRIFDLALSRHALAEGLRIVEAGVSRFPSNGLSTLYWLKAPQVASVVSIDIDADTLVSVGLRLGEALSRRWTPLHGHSLPLLSSLPARSVDLLYLDSDADPALTLHEFLVALPKLAEGAIVLVDDAAVKGRKLTEVLAGVAQEFTHAAYGSWRLEIEHQGVEVHEAEGCSGLLLARILKVGGSLCEKHE